MQRLCPACMRKTQTDKDAENAGYQAAEFTYCLQCGATFVFVDTEYNVVVPRYGINFSDIAYAPLWKNFQIGLLLCLQHANKITTSITPYVAKTVHAHGTIKKLRNTSILQELSCNIEI